MRLADLPDFAPSIFSWIRPTDTKSGMKIACIGTLVRGGRGLPLCGRFAGMPIVYRRWNVDLVVDNDLLWRWDE